MNIRYFFVNSNTAYDIFSYILAFHKYAMNHLLSNIGKNYRLLNYESIYNYKESRETVGRWILHKNIFLIKPILLLEARKHSKDTFHLAIAMLHGLVVATKPSLMMLLLSTHVKLTMTHLRVCTIFLKNIQISGFCPPLEIIDAHSWCLITNPYIYHYFSSLCALWKKAR